MYGLRLSRKMDRVSSVPPEPGATMHPTLMTMIADDRAQGLRSAAEPRRGRVVRTGQRRFFVFRRPRRSARVAHA
jgi:hypothetical protein